MDCGAAGAVSNQLNDGTAGMGMMDPMGMHGGLEDLPPEVQMEMRQQQAQMAENWAQDFMDPAMMAQLHEHQAMEQEFLAQQHHMHQQQQQQQVAAAAVAADAEAQMMNQQWGEAQHHEQDQALQAVFAATEAPSEWMNQFHEQEGEKWANDYNENDVQVFTTEGEPIRSFEEKQKDSKFLQFMNEVKSGDVVIEEGGVTSAPQDGEFSVNEFMNGAAPPEGVSAAEWAAEHLGDLNGMGMVDSEANALDEAWAEGAEGGALDEAWGDAAGLDDYGAEFFANGENGEMMDPDNWAQEYEKITQQFKDVQDSTDYPFDPNNPYLFHDDPFTEGQQLLSAGTVSEAVLAFEAACQKDGSQPQFWQSLGTTQAENEKDQLAIKALNKARQLEPTNLAVHMGLSVSHTNEGNHNLALRSLRDWIRAHPEHDAICGFMEGMGETGAAAAVAANEMEDEFSRDYMFISPSEHRDVCALYQAAIEMNPQDAELHIGLGILRNLSHEYDLAAESFTHALKARPADAKLWNKLGATLANGNRSREALAAYDKALDINPGYVRAQYNLGVSHSNLGEHELAVKQFIRAIVMQQGGVSTGAGDPNSNRSTRELWDVLRMTLNLMERPDLVSLAWKQDCQPFLQEFGLTELL